MVFNAVNANNNGGDYTYVSPNPNPNPNQNDLAFKVDIISPDPIVIPNRVDRNIFNEIDATCIISQNMNSTNMSSLAQVSDENKFHEKVNALIKQKSNIYLMQDIRLGTHSEKFKRELLQNRFGNFDCYLNSKKTERGVGILIRRG